MKFSTKAIWVGQEADKSTGATIVPIYQTSTFTQEQVGKHKGYEYTRCGNPTRTALDSCLASLEEGKYCLSFSSGLAAEHAVLSLLSPGDHVLAPEDMYGGTYRLLSGVFKPIGIDFSLADAANPEAFRNAIRPNTRIVWLETPTNPLLRIFDIGAIAEICKEKNISLVVDNTFASPYFQQPLAWGADIVVHSTTKYINGHSDVIGGAVVLNDQTKYERLKFLQNAIGAVPSPFDSWLTLRGLKTLVVRMKQHEQNAFRVAEFLSGHGFVEEVLYPGLPEHPGHPLAKRQMKGFGGVVSFRIHGGLDEANRFFKHLRIFQLADSLGGVESLANYSAIMTHESYPSELKKKIGISENLIRLSVGIEDADDLVQDLKEALNRIQH